MSRQVSPSTDKLYSLVRVTRIWGISRATLYRHRRPSKVVERKRPGPLGAMSDENLVVAIRQLLTDSPFHGEGYRKLWARRSAPTTLAQTDPRPSRGDGCRHGASRRRCCGCFEVRIWSWSRANSASPPLS